MPPSRQADFEAAIIRVCEEHEREHKSEHDFRRCVVADGAFIKFGSYKSLRPLYETQKYISQLADSDTSAPLIPKILAFFNRNYQMAYLVMEYIKPCTPVSNLPQRVALALQWLRHLLAPDSVTIGPVGNSRARHTLFKNYTAPLLSRAQTL